MEKITQIYLLTNLDNDPFKVYIGKTVNLTRRLRDHKAKYHKNIKCSIIDECNTSQWKVAEKYWISQFKEWGFILDNKNSGGGGVGIMGKVQKNKIAIAKTNHPCYTDERNKKIGISNKKPKPKLRKSVIQLDKQEKFIRLWDSISEAQIEMTGHNIGGISVCCLGKQKTAYGYRWKYGKKNT